MDFSTLWNLLGQTFFIGVPPLNGGVCPDQLGRVHLITGGYGGCGFELAKILYQHNAIVYLAGRSVEKGVKAAEALKRLHPNSKGEVKNILVDLSDLTTIKPAVRQFLKDQRLLHCLTLNHGVMCPPLYLRSAQGYDLQLATNCLGSYLLYKILRPVLIESAADASVGSVRVTWASSSACDAIAPYPGGIKFSDGAPDDSLSSKVMYGQTKAGNAIIAGKLALQDEGYGIMHLSWNPGNLRSDLERHLSRLEKLVSRPILHPVQFGGYTELFAAVGDIPRVYSGRYIAPWGKVGRVRPDIQAAIDDTCPRGTGQSWMKWLERVVAPFA